LLNCSDKFAPVHSDSIYWNELLAPNRFTTTMNTKRSAQARYLLAPMAYFMCDGACLV